MQQHAITMLTTAPTVRLGRRLTRPQILTDLLAPALRQSEPVQQTFGISVEAS